MFAWTPPSTVRISNGFDFKNRNLVMLRVENKSVNHIYRTQAMSFRWNMMVNPLHRPVEKPILGSWSNTVVFLKNHLISKAHYSTDSTDLNLACLFIKEKYSFFFLTSFYNHPVMDCQRRQALRTANSKTLWVKLLKAMQQTKHKINQHRN